MALALSAALMVPALPAPAAAAVRPPSITVPSASLMTMSGTLGWSTHRTSRRRVASTIKMLNALVAREHTSLDETVTITRKSEAINDGDVGLVRGQVFKVRELLRMMLVASANDAAEALAIHVGGTEKAYVAMMNAKAKALGLKNTTAVDPHGLSEKERSTAADLSVLARHVMADSALRATVNYRFVTVRRPNKKTRTFKSTNLLLDHYKGIEGVKTGYTSDAGYCFVGAAKRDGVELVGVVLGAKSLSARFSQMRKLLDWGFKHCKLRTLVSREQTRSIAPIASDPLLAVTVRPETTVTLAVFDGGTIATTVTLEPDVSLPIAAGQRLGAVTVTRNGVVLARVPLLAESDVTAEPLLPASTLRWFGAPR
jgi:serine-type D-Ala-D-Ala carboxypeptidase (penicillin-binding protein 5/6)